MLVRLLLALAMLLAAVPAAHAQDSFTPEQQRAVRELLRQELKEHPELVLDAIRQLQARDREAAEERRRDLLKLNADTIAAEDGDFVLGNPRGDVTVVEFFDYRCPYCKAMLERVQALVKSDPKLRLVLKEFPILGAASTLASKASLAAMPQGRYLAFHTALMAHRGELDDKALTTLARSAGIDVAKMKARMEDPEVTAKLARNIDLGRALDVEGTPAFIIGERVIPGAVELETLRAAIAEARK
jgi:protein-disulfide isomerase